MPTKQFLSFEEAAQYLGVSRATIYRWTHKYDLKFIRIGRVTKIDKDQIDKFMRSPQFRRLFVKKY